MATAARPKVYKPKTVTEAWCSDTGAYPVMGVIVFAVCFCSAYMGYQITTHPDSRVNKHSRKSIFRGELKEYYNNGDDASVKDVLGIK
jgi:hypothetical protein